MLKGKMKLWNKTTFGNIFKDQRDLEEQMKQLQQKIISEGWSTESENKEKSLTTQLAERSQEEILVETEISDMLA